MVKEAQANAATDSNRREKIEAHNEGDNAAYQAEKMLRENGDKIPAAAKTEIEEKIAAVRQVIAGEDVAAMRSATEALRNTLANAGAAMYEQPTDGAAQGNGAPKPPDDDVIDGEVREDK